MTMNIENGFWDVECSCDAAEAIELLQLHSCDTDDGVVIISSPRRQCFSCLRVGHLLKTVDEHDVLGKHRLEVITLLQSHDGNQMDPDLKAPVAMPDIRLIFCKKDLPFHKYVDLHRNPSCSLGVSLGCLSRETPQGLLRQLQVIDVEPDSTASQLNINAGDVVVRIDDVNFDDISPETLREKVKSSQKLCVRTSFIPATRPKSESPISPFIESTSAALSPTSSPPSLKTIYQSPTSLFGRDRGFKIVPCFVQVARETLGSSIKSVTLPHVPLRLAMANPELCCLQVHSVERNSHAYNAGLKPNDIILMMNSIILQQLEHETALETIRRAKKPFLLLVARECEPEITEQIQVLRLDARSSQDSLGFELKFTTLPGQLRRALIVQKSNKATSDGKDCLRTGDRVVMVGQTIVWSDADMSKIRPVLSDTQTTFMTVVRKLQGTDIEREKETDFATQAAQKHMEFDRYQPLISNTTGAKPFELTNSGPESQVATLRTTSGKPAILLPTNRHQVLRPMSNHTSHSYSIHQSQSNYLSPSKTRPQHQDATPVENVILSSGVPIRIPLIPPNQPSSQPAFFWPDSNSVQPGPPPEYRHAPPPDITIALSPPFNGERVSGPEPLVNQSESRLEPPSPVHEEIVTSPISDGSPDNNFGQGRPRRRVVEQVVDEDDVLESVNNVSPPHYSNPPSWEEHQEMLSTYGSQLSDLMLTMSMNHDDSEA